ncbi:MAG: hypothetical protein AAB562_02760, partial [Patescibacteria group bacterium]
AGFDVVVTTGATTIAGSADGTDALTLTLGDILLSDGELTLSGGDLDVTLDADADASLTKTAANASGVDLDPEEGLEINFNAGIGNADDVYRALVLDVASANHGAATDLVIGLDIDALAGADAEGVETAIRIGASWDTILDTAGFDVIGATGATTITGSAEGTAALTLTAGDARLTDGDLVITSGDIDGAGFDVVVTTGATTIAGSAEGTAALTLTAGDVRLTDGDLVITSGDIDGAGFDVIVTTGATTITGSALGTDALTLTAGDILLTSGNFDMTSGDFNVNVVDGQSANLDGDTSPTADLLILGNGDTTATTGTDALVISLAVNDSSSNPSSNLVNISPAFTDDGADGTAGETWNVLNINAYTATLSADAGGTLNAVTNAVNIGNLTETVGGDETITSTALNLGTGWDTIFNTAGFDVTGATGATTITGSAEGTAALTLTAGDARLTDGDLVITSGDIDGAGFDVVVTTGATTIAGSADGTDALTLTLGDILLSDGELTLSGGDLDVTLDADADASLTKTAANASGVDLDPEEGLEINFNAGIGNADDVYRALVLDVASANHGAATDLVIGLDIDALAGADAEGVETAIRIGASWDTILDTAGFDVIGATGATTITGSAEGTAALTLTAGDVVLTDGDITLTSGDFEIPDNSADALTLEDATGGLDYLQIVTTDGAETMVFGHSTVDSQTFTTDGTGDGEIVLPTGAISSGEILDDTIVTGDLNATLTFADDDLITLAAINNSDGAEGLILPQNATACSAAIADGQICWDTAGDDLYIGDGAAAVQMNGAAGGARLDQITAATTTATIANANNAIAWNWGTLTTQTGMTFGGGTAMTTGSIFALGGATYVHGAETGSLASLTFTDATTAAVTSTTNGLLISPTINAPSGAATRTINGLSVNPAFTACAAGTCAVSGVNIASVTDGTGFTGTALQIGTGWDTIFDTSGFDVVNTTGATTITGSALGTDALTLTAGDILLTSGNFDMTSGDFNVNVVDGQSANLDGDTSPTADLLILGNGDTTATTGTDALVISLAVNDSSSNPSSNLVNISPAFTDDGADGTAGETWNVLNINAYTATLSADAGGTLNAVTNAVNIGNLTETVGGDETITSTALNLGTGWDTIFNTAGFDVTGATGATTITGSAEGTAALTLTAGDARLTDGDLVITSGDIDGAGFDVVVTTGATTIAGSADGTDALTLTLGDILLSDGELTLSGGDLDVTLDADADASLTKTAANASGVDLDPEEGLEINFNAGIGNADDVYRALVLDVASANHGAATDLVIGLDIDALAGADAEGVETAIRIGASWDTILDTAGFDVIGATGATTITGSAEGTAALTLTAGD